MATDGTAVAARASNQILGGANPEVQHVCQRHVDCDNVVPAHMEAT